MLSQSFAFGFLALYIGFIGVDGALGNDRQAKPQQLLGYGTGDERYKAACPDYRHYAAIPQ
jgi:hypothetical protein